MAMTEARRAYLRLYLRAWRAAHPESKRAYDRRYRHPTDPALAEQRRTRNAAHAQAYRARLKAAR